MRPTNFSSVGQTTLKSKVLVFPEEICMFP